MATSKDLVGDDGHNPQVLVSRNVTKVVEEIAKRGERQGYGSDESCASLEAEAKIQQTNWILAAKIMVFLMAGLNMLKESFQLLQVADNILPTMPPNV